MIAYPTHKHQETVPYKLSLLSKKEPYLYFIPPSETQIEVGNWFWETHPETSFSDFYCLQKMNRPIIILSRIWHWETRNYEVLKEELEL